MKSILITFLMLLLFSNPLAAQEDEEDKKEQPEEKSYIGKVPPGYMGKRLVTEYNLTTFSPVAFPNANFNRTILPTNFAHNLKLEYVLTRKISIAAGFEMLNTSIDLSNMDYIAVDLDDPQYSTSDYYQRELDVKPDGYAGVRSMNFDFSVNLYNHLAPWGKYHRLGAKLYLFQIDPQNDAFTVDLQEEISYDEFGPLDEFDYSDQVPIKDTYGTWGLSYEFGRQRVLFNKITLRYGMKFTGVVGIVNKVASLDFGGSRYVTESYLGNQAKQRLFFHQLINFSIGIGFLAY